MSALRFTVPARLLLLLLSAPAAVAVESPIIGILTVPSTAEEPCATLGRMLGADPSASCVTIFYQLWLQAAGARVAWVPWSADTSTLDTLFASLNGLLFTGGSQDLRFNTTYLQTAKYLFNKVLAANDAGDYFPLHGTCMGFQTISILAAEDETVLETYAYDSEGISWPLNFTADANSTRLWGGAPADVFATFATVNSTVNLHHDGVPPSAYARSPRMAELLVMTSTNVDRVGKPFVSSWTGRSHPVATQFNPGLGISHTRDVIEANRYIADFFVAEARRSNHVFDPALGPLYSAAAFTPTFIGDPLNNFGAYLMHFPKPAPTPSPTPTPTPDKPWLEEELSVESALGVGVAVGAVGVLGLAFLVPHLMASARAWRAAKQDDQQAPLLR